MKFTRTINIHICRALIFILEMHYTVEQERNEIKFRTTMPALILIKVVNVVKCKKNVLQRHLLDKNFNVFNRFPFLHLQNY